MTHLLISRRIGILGEPQGSFEAYLSANRIVGSMKGQNGYTA